MPIRPENINRYPSNWSTEIVPAILKRAGYKCEGSPEFPDCRVEQYSRQALSGAKIVLTIAHLDHIPENCDPSNLRAWCQRCHLNYDRQHHAESRYKNAREGKALGDLFESEPKQYCYQHRIDFIGMCPECEADLEADDYTGFLC